MKAKLQLTISLSMFGLVVGILNVNAVLVDFQWLFWLGFYVVVGFLLAKQLREKIFLHAFISGFLFTAFFYAIKILSLPLLLENNQNEKEVLLQLPDGMTPSAYLISFGMIVAVFSGVVMGLMTSGMQRFIKKKTLPENL